MLRGNRSQQYLKLNMSGTRSPFFPPDSLQKIPKCSTIGSIVVPVGGLYLESYKVLPKRSYYGAYGYLRVQGAE